VRAQAREELLPHWEKKLPRFFLGWVPLFFFFWGKKKKKKKKKKPRALGEAPPPPQKKKKKARRTRRAGGAEATEQILARLKGDEAMIGRGSRPPRGGIQTAGSIEVKDR